MDGSVYGRSGQPSALPNTSKLAVEAGDNSQDLDKTRSVPPGVRTPHLIRNLPPSPHWSPERQASRLVATNHVPWVRLSFYARRRAMPQSPEWVFA